MIAQIRPKEKTIPSQHSATQGKSKRTQDLVDLATFGAKTKRVWLVKEALAALQREGLWTPELSSLTAPLAEHLSDQLNLVAEALRPDVLWLVADSYDALRLESYGFPALAMEPLTHLTHEHIPVPWLIVVARPGEEETLCGIDVWAELRRLNWIGRLSRIPLPFIDFDDAERECGEGFALWLADLLTHATHRDMQPLETAPQMAGRGMVKVAL